MTDTTTITFEEYLLSEWGMDYDEYSNLPKEEKRSYRKSYEDFLKNVNAE